MSGAGSLPPVPRGRWLLGTLLVFFAATLPLLPTLTNGFVYDDQVLLETGAPDARGAAPVALVDVLTGDLFGLNAAGEPASGYYRPLTRLTYWLEGRLYGNWAAGYHLDNLLLAACVSLLLLGLLRGLPVLAGCALPAALLFAVHPVHAESLALITGRTDPLALACLLMAMLASVRGARWWVVTLFYLAALLSKESAAILFPALALIGRLSPVDARPTMRRVLGLLAACGLTTLLFFGLKIGLLGIVPPDDVWTGAGSRAQRLLTFLAVLPDYVGLLVWPENLSIVHEVALAKGAGDPRIWFGQSLLLLFLVLLRRGTPALRLGLGWMLWTLLPASNLVPISFAYRHIPFAFFERYLFVPSVGALIAVVALIVWATGKLDARRQQLTLLCAVLLLALPLGLRTFLRAREFRSETVLLQAAVETVEQKVPLLLHLAQAQLRSLDAWAALSTFDRARKLDPGHVGVVVGRAQTLSILAQHVFESVADHRNRGLLEDAERIAGNANNMLDDARSSLEGLVAEQPLAAEALEALGTIAGLRGFPLEAARWYRRAALTGRGSPALAGNYRRAAELLRQEARREAGRGAEQAQAAVYLYARGVEALAGAMPPGSIPDPVHDLVLRMLLERADLLLLSGALEQSQAAYREVLVLDPEQFRCFAGLGQIAKQLGHRQEAYALFRRTLQLAPDEFVILQELIVMCQEDGLKEEAGRYIRRFQRVLAENVQRGARSGPGAEDGTEETDKQ